MSTETSPAQVERVVDRPHQIDEFLVDDVDQLLGGIERAEHGFADRLLVDPLHEVLDDGQAHVGLEQSPLNLPAGRRACSTR